MNKPDGGWSNVRGVICDLDNTLYHYEPCNEAALAAAYQLVAESHDVSAERFRVLHDAVRRRLAQRLGGQAAAHNRFLFFKEMVLELTGRPSLTLALDLYDRYWATFLRTMTPAPDAHAVLSGLAERFPLVLLSNNTTQPQTRKILQLDFERYFKVILTSEEVGAEKPAPAMFSAALSALEISPTEAVMLGDNPVADLQGAAAVGIRTVGTVEFSGRARDELVADEVISSLAQFSSLLC